MKVITQRFRCNLCGEFHALGVTEKQPLNPTAICEDCLILGSRTIARHKSKTSTP